MMNGFKSFLLNNLGMPDDARIADVDSPNFTRQLGEIVATDGGT